MLRAGAVGVERVFDHVVPGGADRVEEQLALERRQAEAGAHLAAVDREAGGARRHRLLPFRQHAAVAREQPQPEPHRPGAVAGPVIGCHQPRVQPVAAGRPGVAEEGVVGGEVQPVEVALRVAQHAVRQPRLVQRQHLHAGRHLRRDAGGDAPGVEAATSRVAAGMRQVHQRAARPRRPGLPRAAPRRARSFRRRGGMAGLQRPQRVGDAVRVVDREPAGRAQPVRQPRRRLGGQRVGEAPCRGRCRRRGRRRSGCSSMRSV